MDQIMEPTKSNNRFWDYIEVLNNNKYFVGIIMILLNLGSKYISIELSQGQEKFLGSPIIRRLILFTVFFYCNKRYLDIFFVNCSICNFSKLFI